MSMSRNNHRRRRARAAGKTKTKTKKMRLLSSHTRSEIEESSDCILAGATAGTVLRCSSSSNKSSSAQLLIAS